MPRSYAKKGGLNNTRGSPDENEESNCVICLDRVRCRGKLSVCNHWFCFPCIFEWSKNTNTCPICKARFRCISKLHFSPLKSPPSKTRVPDKDQRVWNDDEDFAVEDIYDIQNDLWDDMDDDYEPPIAVNNPWTPGHTSRHMRLRSRRNQGIPSDDYYDLADPFIDDSDLMHGDFSRAQRLLLQDATYVDSDDEERVLRSRRSPYPLRQNRHRGNGAHQTQTYLSLRTLHESDDESDDLQSGDSDVSEDENDYASESSDQLERQPSSPSHSRSSGGRQHACRTQTRQATGRLQSRASGMEANTHSSRTSGMEANTHSSAPSSPRNRSTRPRPATAASQRERSPSLSPVRRSRRTRRRNRETDARRIERLTQASQIAQNMAETGSSGWITTGRQSAVRTAARSAAQAIAAMLTDQSSESPCPEKAAKSASDQRQTRTRLTYEVTTRSKTKARHSQSNQACGRASTSATFGVVVDTLLTSDEDDVGDGENVEQGKGDEGFREPRSSFLSRSGAGGGCRKRNIGSKRTALARTVRQRLNPATGMKFRASLAAQQDSTSDSSSEDDLIMDEKDHPQGKARSLSDKQKCKNTTGNYYGQDKPSQSQTRQSRKYVILSDYSDDEPMRESGAQGEIGYPRDSNSLDDVEVSAGAKQMDAQKGKAASTRTCIQDWNRRKPNVYVKDDIGGLSDDYTGEGIGDIIPTTPQVANKRSVITRRRHRPIEGSSSEPDTPASSCTSSCSKAIKALPLADVTNKAQTSRRQPSLRSPGCKRLRVK
ncbi:uncharacterized protein LOC116614423 [Nematostella vectensis]|uniref:uncharacterized protein LOC116614423 n=1 Tax=Nematostella vectensis TaxID=45351 RepID=UPI00138FA95E|nr:uncharacterized protein LOC116614423 [Nematostella vectensis]